MKNKIIKNARWSLFLFIITILISILSILIYLVLPESNEPANITLQILWFYFGFINFIFIVISMIVSRRQSKNTLLALKIYKLNKNLFII